MHETENNKTPIGGNTWQRDPMPGNANDERRQREHMELMTQRLIDSGAKRNVPFAAAQTASSASTTAMQRVQFEGGYARDATLPLESTRGLIGAQGQKIISGAMKFDQEKPRMDLLDPLALDGLARVLEFGSRKYTANNWRGGLSYGRLIGALLRHSFAILRGEDTDPESGLPHVDHLGCCWMFLSNQMKTRPDMDDRWKQ